MTARSAHCRRIYLAALHCAALLGLTGVATSQEAAAPVASTPAPEADLPAELPPPSARTNTLIGGAVMAVGWYGVGVGSSFLWSDSPGSEELLIPVAGPWMSLAETGCPESDPDCSVVLLILQATITTLSGVGQAGGLAIMGEGLFVPTRERRAASKPLELKAHVQPLVSARDGVGLGVVGTF